jgi:hypothetical protein
MMFVPRNKTKAKQMAHIAEELEPDEVQINTPLRLSPVPPLGMPDMEAIEGHFKGLGKVTDMINVYKAKRPEVHIDDPQGLVDRGRPKGEKGTRDKS